MARESIPAPGAARAGARPGPGRRAILRAGVVGATAAASLAAGRPPARAAPAMATVPTAGGAHSYDFNRNWLFGGVYVPGSENPGYDDRGFTRVTLPHTVVPLSWTGWDATAWENVWIYRKHFDGAAVTGGRVFIGFDGVMTNARVVFNGVPAGTHVGGYLPWSAELTAHLRRGDNVLAVIVDSRWLDVPPDNLPGGVASIDYLEPGGIYRDATLRVVPDVFISDVFAKPVNVLAPDRSIEVQATIDAAVVPSGPVHVTAELLDGTRTLATASAAASVAAAGTTVADLTITGIGDVTYWSPETPRLYTVRTSLSYPGPGRAGGGSHPAPSRGSHSVPVRIGFREATFKPGGFYLNGQRYEIFGLNRHQLFPYTGMAAPARLQRRDAEILRNELNCNMVRCSHYPQSPHFLDACDELGLMCWEEPPGWGYVGDAAFQDVVLENVHDMVIRDRNRPSLIVWATRLNETANYPALYARARQIAYDLDGSRQTAGAVTFRSLAGWAEDVFSYDDYQYADGQVELFPPIPGVPYLVSEAVGAIVPSFKWTDPAARLALQARAHAQVHDLAQANTGYAGLLAWAGIDYASLSGGVNNWNGLKTPGVVDTFRVPKPGAMFYQSQVDPVTRPLILPTFFWDFGPGSPASGPGANAMICTNCDRLELYVAGEHFATGTPDRQGYGSLAYPPVFTDLTVDGATHPELRIDGYLGGRPVTTVRMSADTSRDRLAMTVDDTSIHADGTDATRVTFRALDAYGNQRPYVSGSVVLSLSGPATLIGQNPFDFALYGGVGGAFVRSLPGRTGRVSVTAWHRTLGGAQVGVTITPAVGTQFL